MSVQTGIAPSELLALDAPMFDAIAKESDRHWPASLELAAATLEVAHAHLIAFLQANSKKGTRLPEPLVVPRPGQTEDEKPKPTSIGELVAMPGLTADMKRSAAE